jgi:flagellar motor switch protein FliG
VIAEIERSLRVRLAPGAAVTGRPLADEQKISRVLTAVDAEANQPATELEDSPRLAPSQHRGANIPEPNVDPLALTFADLEYLDAELLSVTLQKARADLVCLALAGAKSSFVQTVLNRLSLREARSLRRQMESLGPTRLSDMERAQHELAQLAEMVLIAALQGTGVGPTARS